jgi:hypothetical protein
MADTTPTSEPEVPAYAHDYDDCIYLGPYQYSYQRRPADLWLCPSEPTVISRFSDEPSDYASGLYSLTAALLEGKARAIRLLVKERALTTKG